MFIKDRQATVQLQSDQGQYRFFFEKSDLDTVKIYHEGKKSYLHFFGGEIKEYATKKALRRELSRESGGAWVEEKEERKRYFVEEKGWLWNSIKEVSKEEFLQKENGSSTLQKIMGLGLGILSLSTEVVETLHHSPIGVREAGIVLAGMHAQSKWIGGLGCILFSNFVEAQKVGSEFRVNTNTTSTQRHPDVAALETGGFVVVWDSQFQDGNLTGIFGQRFDENGLFVGPEFQINTYTTNIQQNPSVSSFNNGSFVVVWESVGQDGSAKGIYGQMYNRDGAPIREEFQVNVYTTNEQDTPRVAPLSDRGFIVVWTSEGQDGDRGGIYAQRYNSEGNLVGSEFRVNTYTTNNQWNPDVALLESGHLIVTWQSNGQDGSSEGVYYQRLGTDGLKIGSEVQVNTYTESTQGLPNIESLRFGGFVIGWSSQVQDGDDFGIYGQRFAPEGAALGNEFQVNNFTQSRQWYPSIVALNDGGYVFVWASSGQDGDGYGVFGQRYDPYGNRVGLEFLVNTHIANNQLSPRSAGLENGDYVVVWASELQDGDSYGIYAQRFHLDPLPVTSLQSSIQVLMTESSMRISTSSISNSKTSTRSFSPSLSDGSTTTGRSINTSISTSSEGLRSTQLPTSSITDTSFESPSLSSQIDTSLLSTEAVSSSPREIVYGFAYSITYNNQSVGTFSFEGGVGAINSNVQSVLTIEFNGNYIPEDGDVIVLFNQSTANIDANVFEGVTVEVDGASCLDAEPNTEEDASGNVEYQVIFSLADSCTTNAVQNTGKLISMLVQ